MESEPPTADLPKRKHRWFQVSLRTLLIGVTIVAVQCAVCFPALKVKPIGETWTKKIVGTHIKPMAFKSTTQS
jgi:hypothetical protein